ncbi:transcriptional activator [Murinocardiopsis flavida]|uniref:Transcriptional activator n=1 Tax=Murinocardiopsis flavida TaxID=645275 RepID=A0A2P8CYA5_9ACTN|nr:OmpA family protein [Murinocardiopsis flavida]PSK89943.1 transcriptional activator [Murinocardiopsis flavida]
MRRGLRQAGALLVTIALLAGLPYAATVPLAWPTPELSWVSVLAYLRGGSLPPGVATAALITGLWAVWGLHLLALLTELTARLRGHPVRTRMFGPLQLLTATAIGAALTAPPAHAATPPGPAEAEPDTANAAPAAQHANPGAAEQDVPHSSGRLVERERVIDGFVYDSAALTPDMEEDLKPTIDMIRTHGSTRAPVVVTGHTDAAGASDYNRDLSQRRADAVAQHLRSQLGDTAPVVQTRGLGADHLLDGAPDTVQRRVDISYALTAYPSPEPTPPRETPKPDSAPAQQEQNGAGSDERRAVLVLELPGGLLLTATAAAGVLGGFALGRRRNRTSAHPEEKDEVSGANPGAHTEVTDAETPPPDAVIPDSTIDPRAIVDLRNGVGITGPGAHAAARSLLATALHPDETPLHVIIPSGDLGLLLGDEGAAYLAEHATPAVTSTASLDAAITVLHTELLSRVDGDADDETQPESETAEEETAPFLLLATPTPEHTPEITTLLGQADASAISAVLLGDWPGGTCTIDSTHTITEASPPLAHLLSAHWPATGRDHFRTLISDLPPRTPSGQSTASNPPSPTPAPAQPSSGQPAQETPAPTTLRVLGRITLTADGQALTLRRRSAFEVAAYLATRPDGVRMERAIEDMWPGENAARATRRFHDATSALRTALRPFLGEQSPAVLHENDLYRLNPESVDVDLRHMEAALSTAEGDTREEAAKALAPILEHYGDFAEEAGYAWAEEPRSRLRRRLIDAAVRCADQCGHDAARALLARAAVIDPHHEPVHLELIRLHLDTGDTRAAAEVYQAHKDALHEIGVEPGRRIRDLVSTSSDNSLR